MALGYRAAEKVYQETLDRITKNRDEWISFLNSSTWMFEYTFGEQLLIYAQRPEARACASMEDWNKKASRWIKRNSKGITIMKYENGQNKLELLFDIADTYPIHDSNVGLWKLDKNRQWRELTYTLVSKYGDFKKKNSLEESLVSTIDNFIEDSLIEYFEEFKNIANKGSLTGVDEEELKFIYTETIRQNLIYTVFTRCDLDPFTVLPNYNFEYITYFDSVDTINNIGVATRDLSRDMIREIRAFVKNKKERGDLNEHRIQSSERLSNTEYRNREQRNSNNGQIRTNEGEIFERKQTMYVRADEDDRNTNTTLELDTENLRGESSKINRTNETTREYNRGNEREKSNAVGRNDEQLENDSRVDDTRRNDIQLDSLLSEDEQKHVITGVENTSVFSFTQEMIDSVLQEGSNFAQGKFRIYEQLTSFSSSKENIEFLKKEYGIGGRSADSNGINEDHSPKGIVLRKGYNDDSPQLKLSWNEVEKRIKELIRLDRYLNSKEKEEYEKWLLNEQETVVEIKDDNKEKEFLYLKGDKVFIGSIEYEIVVISSKEVLLSEVQCPLLVKEMSFEEFDRKAKENPYNEHLDKSNRTEQELHENILEIIEEDEFNKWLDTYIEEKGIDLDETFSIQTDSNIHYFEIGNVIENIKTTTKEEQEKIKDMIVKIDFANGDVIDYFKHLARALADNYEIVAEQEIKREEPIIEDKFESSNLKKIRKNKIEHFDLHPEVPLSERNNYQIKDNELGVGTLKEKYSRNIKAIKVLKKCNAENRYATKEEQEILANYVGWGGIPDVFDRDKSNWSSEYEELKQLLTEKEYEQARQSTLTAFYTPPFLIKSIYKALENMGLEKGNILEPSCGVGNFLGMLPDSLKECKIYGVEIDSISGEIARQLYQRNTIAIKGYEEVEMPDSFFDVAVGNVPFGDYKLADKRYDKNNFLIHDYFFAKTLDKVRPDGVIAFVTSKGTLDKRNSSFRKYLAQRADLLGAIRLPNDTFKNNAGTKITTDIIFLQKKDKITEIEPEWLDIGIDDNGIEMNQYFVSHPNMVLGKMEMVSTQFGMRPDCVPIPNSNLEELLDVAIQNIKAKIINYELDEIGIEEYEAIPATPDVKNYSYTVIDDKIYYRENSIMILQEVPLTTEKRIKSMVELRDCLRNLIELQSEDASETEIEKEQERLNLLYDKFTATYGIINDRANEKAFKEDDSYYLLCSLEIVNENREFVRKADMFHKRTIKAHKEVSMAENAVDALILSISEKATVDMEYMSRLTGKDEKTLAKELEGSIYKDPIKDKYVTADEYLSGDIREKLRIAKKLAETDSNYNNNVQALEKMKPEDLTASEISVKLGTTWIPANDIRDFVFELLDTDYWYRKKIRVEFSKYTSEWNIAGKNEDYNNVKATVTYGTSRVNAYKIIETTLNLKDVKVFDKVINQDGKEEYVLNTRETAIAQSKQDLIKDKFQEWIWKDHDRRERLVEYYNEHFNCIRPREYDGQYIVFSGMNPEITLRKHQKNAIARILYGGNTLLAHEVGAGKTFEMVAAAMESKRLGLCNKSLFVVPNHIIEQFAGDFLRLYPSANILVTTKADFSTNNRKRFCSKIATGDYDAIIIGHSQFEKIPMSKAVQKKYIKEQIDEVLNAIDDASYEEGTRYTVKQLEAVKRRLEERLKKLNDESEKDNVINFEELGVDRLFVDESHYYKNLYVYSKMRNVSGIAQAEAKKSSDLFMKCRYLDEITGGKGIIFATGTPVTNTMVELYTLQRYLQYNTLKKYNLLNFDDWASNFGETITTVELKPEGTGYRAKTRFARFYNLPELMNMFKEVADIQTAEMLNLPVPKANFHIVKAKPSEIQKEMVSDLGTRAEAIRNGDIDPRMDNMLKITNEGRKLALDQRIMNENLPDFEGSKINMCVNNIYNIWQSTKDKKLTQLIFCDLSTPANNGKFNIYDDIKNKLIEKGVPESEVAFIHDADNELKKKELFAKTRQGIVRNLLGSTSKMGAGTNVQDKIIALHHLDAPWKPSDLKQRNGRGIRQGNENDEINVYTYVTEGTFDAYLYQILENKQKFISQIMTSKIIPRSQEDIDSEALTYAEIKGLASGNKLISEKVELDTQVSKLRLLKQEFLNQKYKLEDSIIKYYPAEIKKYTLLVECIEKDINIVKEKTNVENEEKFSGMSLKGVVYSKKEDAGKMLLEILKKKDKLEVEEIGEYRGLKMFLEFDTFSSLYKIRLKNNAIYTTTLSNDVYGNITRIDNSIENMSRDLEMAKVNLNNTEQQFSNAKLQVEEKFQYEDELKVKQEKLNIINAKLNLENKEANIVVIDEVEINDSIGKVRSKEYVR